VSQTVNGITTNFVLDLNSGLTQVLQESAPQGYGTHTYQYGGGRIAQHTATTAEYFLTDALGSVRQMTDASGSVVSSQSYQPFGEELSSQGTAESRYGYTGEQTDSYIKLIYLRSRYYSPVTGRFQTRDTWQGDYNTPMSYNAWLYGYANPVRYTDPTGKMPWQVYQDYVMSHISDYLSRGYLLEDLDFAVAYKRGRNHSISKRMLWLIQENFGDGGDVNDYNNPGKHVIRCNGKFYLTLMATALDGYSGKKADYNKYDRLISGWSSYWSYRSNLEGKDYGLALDPNLLKAIAMRETGVGTIAYDQRSGSPLRGVFPFSRWELYALGGICLTCTSDPKDLDNFNIWSDMTWGLFSTELWQPSVSASYIEPNLNIAMFGRLFYRYIHNKYLNFGSDRSLLGSDTLLKAAIGGYVENTGSMGPINQIWDMYKSGAYCSSGGGLPVLISGPGGLPNPIPPHGFCSPDSKLLDYSGQPIN